MNNYQLLVDVWEAETNLDYAALMAGDVAGVVIRLNDMNGGHHMDANFTDQWAKAGEAGLIRAPYFVYNPWVTGQANYEWIMSHLPPEAGRVFIDIEVTYPNYSPATYAGEVVKFLDLLGNTNPTTIYTGEWFLNRLKSWPKATYWWAQYMTALYPMPGRVDTWEHVKQILAAMPDKPTNSTACAGIIKMWQISGDRLILPGSPKPIDVNVFFGTREELQDWIGGIVETPPDSDPDPITGETITSFTVPSAGTYYQTLHDYECKAWNYMPRSIYKNYKKDPPANALPETVPLLNKKEQFYPLSEAWQNWWFELLKLASYGGFSDDELKERWFSLTDEARAFTDRHSRPNGFIDYILGVNLGSAKGPMQIKALTTGGNLLKVLGVNGTKLTVECLNFSKAPPAVEDIWLKKPWMYQWATQETVLKLANKTYRVVPFPQLNPHNGTPVPVGSWDGTQIIDKLYAKKLSTGKTYGIYNP